MEVLIDQLRPGNGETPAYLFIPELDDHLPKPDSGTLRSVSISSTTSMPASTSASIV